MTDPIRDSINGKDEHHRAATYKTLAKVEALCGQVDRLENDIREQRKEDARIAERLTALKYATPEDTRELWNHLRGWETQLSARLAEGGEKIAQLGKALDECRADVKVLRQGFDALPKIREGLSKAQVAGMGAGLTGAAVAVGKVLEWIWRMIQ